MNSVQPSFRLIYGLENTVPDRHRSWSNIAGFFIFTRPIVVIKHLLCMKTEPVHGFNPIAMIENDRSYEEICFRSKYVQGFLSIKAKINQYQSIYFTIVRFGVDCVNRYYGFKKLDICWNNSGTD